MNEGERAREDWRSVLASPLVMEHAKRALAAEKRGEPVRIRYAWEALADQRAHAGLVGLGLTKLPDGGEPYRQALATRIYAARTYLWTPEDLDLAASAPLPRHVFGGGVEAVVPSFWALAHDLSVIDDAGVHTAVDDLGATAIFVDQDRDSVIFAAIMTDDTKGVRLSVVSAPLGSRWPDDVPDYAASSFELLVRMFWYWQTAGSQTVMSDPRSERRRLQRSGVPLDVPLVHLVSRRSARDSAASGRRLEARHWVSGHFKEQWFPSLQAHRVKWIDPYLRGPRGAEIVPRQAAGVVYRVGSD